MPASTEAEGTAPAAPAMTPEGAAEALDRLRAARPDLWAQARPGTRKGIHAYDAAVLPGVYARACNNFRGAHGRLPDPASPLSTADHWFSVKFFHEIPQKPANPADKLAAIAFLSKEMRDRVGFPSRFWISERPVLPPDGAIPAGPCWLKISNGNAMQERVVWPPSPERRRALEGSVALWWRARYGVGWGEWWYALVRPRLYLEHDLSDLMEGRPEIKIFVREGRPVLLYAIRRHPDGHHEQSYFLPDGTALEGRSPGNRPLEGGLPDTAGLMLAAAAEAGRAFRACRVDFLNAAGPRPSFGEFTLCHNNARKVLAPAALDDLARRLLFE